MAVSRIWPLAAIGFGFMGYAAWNQSYWWAALEDNRFGWLTPAFVAFVLWDRRGEIIRRWNACSAAGSRRAKGWQGAILACAVVAGLALGLLAFLVGALYRAGAGPSLKGTVIASTGVVAILLTLPWLAAPPAAEPSPSGFAGDTRWALCLILLFPATIWFLSAPLITVVESQLSLYLLRPIVAAVAFVFDMLGLPLGREGNVLVLPDHGRLGVEEACSGIRSLTGCLFAGSFLGALFLQSLWQKIVLVVAATAFALFMNLLRAFFLAGWAYGHGSAAIEGTVHDAAGYSVMIVTVLGLFGLVAFFNELTRRSRSAAERPSI